MTDRVYESLVRIAASGVAILVIEQNVDRSLAIADRAYVLNRGVISFAGAPADLRDRALLHDAYFRDQPPTSRPTGQLSALDGGTP
jgi:branched-chain amino acid transport system ATP-binding protein